MTDSLTLGQRNPVLAHKDLADAAIGAIGHPARVKVARDVLARQRYVLARQV